MPNRAQRIAFMLLPGLDHFTPDLLARLPAPGLEVRPFLVHGMADLTAALAWADDPEQDVIWFEFCWPPFPAMIAQTDFGGRRVVVRVHRIEAYGTKHAAGAPWRKIDDVITVSQDMAARLLAEAPALKQTTEIHIVHNGVDITRFTPAPPPVPFRIGWCGWLNLHKNPNMALEILHLLRETDPRWHLHLCTKGGDHVALDSFNHLKHRLHLDDAVTLDGNIAQSDMPAWHARNTILLSTSVYESFGYAMAEAAACGCDVVMLDQPGAAEFWPEEMRFATTGEAALMILSARPNKWRDLAEKFSLERQVAHLRELLHPQEAAALAPRITANDDLLDRLSSTPAVLRIDQRHPDEMEAAAFLLTRMGYTRMAKCSGGFLYRHRDHAPAQ